MRSGVSVKLPGKGELSWMVPPLTALFYWRDLMLKQSDTLVAGAACDQVGPAACVLHVSSDEC